MNIPSLRFAESFLSLNVSKKNKQTKKKYYLLTNILFPLFLFLLYSLFFPNFPFFSAYHRHNNSNETNNNNK